MLLGVFDGTLPPPRAIGILALYLLFAVISIASDRRALLVSGLAYFVYAAATLFGRSDSAIMPAAIIVGATLLALSAFWTPIRAAVVIYFPEGVRNRVPPIRRGPQHM